MRAAGVHNRIAKAQRNQYKLAAAAPGAHTHQSQLDDALMVRSSKLGLGDRLRAAAEAVKNAANAAKEKIAEAARNAAAKAKEAAEKVAAKAKEAAEKTAEAARDAAAAAKAVAASVKENGIRSTIKDIKDDGDLNGSNRVSGDAGVDISDGDLEDISVEKGLPEQVVVTHPAVEIPSGAGSADGLETDVNFVVHDRHSCRHGMSGTGEPCSLGWDFKAGDYAPSSMGFNQGKNPTVPGSDADMASVYNFHNE
ncbi:hypothetical protein T484DRAFT_1967407, partial [Baffinella frigidus]